MAGEVVMIVGGTRGLGAALAQAARRREARVAVCGRSALNLTRADWLSRACDIRDAKRCAAFVQAALDWGGRIDVAIVCAGVIADARFTKMTPEAWRRVLDVNLTATLNVVQPVFAQMCRQNAGRLYLMTSTAGMFGVFGQANYAASKAGLIALTQTLALEGARHGVVTEAIAPAAVTEMTRPALARAQAQADAAGTPLPAYWRIGSAQAFAASFWRLDDSRPASGQVFGINGAHVLVYPPRTARPYPL